MQFASRAQAKLAFTNSGRQILPLPVRGMTLRQSLTTYLRRRPDAAPWKGYRNRSSAQTKLFATMTVN